MSVGRCVPPTMFIQLLISYALFALVSAQTTDQRPTLAEIYYKRTDDNTPGGDHDSFGQPLPPVNKARVKNFILVIPDGFGPASEVGSYCSYLIFRPSREISISGNTTRHGILNCQRISSLSGQLGLKREIQL